MITVTHVSRFFGSFSAVNDLSFSINDGEMVVILGPNGAGKTTTLRMLSTIISPTSGEIFYDSEKLGVSRHTDQLIRYRIGFLSENAGLYEGLTVYENLLFFGSLYKLEKRFLDSNIHELSKVLNVEHLLNVKVKKLSKGNKQRASIARALLHNPKYILLDEPTSSLDPISAKIVRDTLLLLRKAGRTIIITTHNLGEATTLATRIILLNRSIMADGSIDKLYSYFKKGRTYRVLLSGNTANVADLLKGLTFVSEFKLLKDDELILTLSGEMDNNWRVIDGLRKAGVKVTLFENYGNDLESIYITVFGGR